LGQDRRVRTHWVKIGTDEKALSPLLSFVAIKGRARAAAVPSPQIVKRDAGTSAMKTGHAAIVIIEPTDVERAGMAGADLPALPGARRGRGATIGRDLADRQRLAAVLNGGVGLGGVHGGWGALIGRGGQGRTYVPTGKVRAENCKAEARGLLEQNMDIARVLVAALIEKGTLLTDEIDAIISTAVVTLLLEKGRQRRDDWQLAIESVRGSTN
jgi:hypothetical protein